MTDNIREQLELPQANYRKTDPETSKLAAEGVEARGIAATHRTMCLSAVESNQGCTAAEIAKLCHLERHVPSRRLPELRALGLVQNGPARTCTVQCTKSITWWTVKYT